MDAPAAPQRSTRTVPLAQKLTSNHSLSPATKHAGVEDPGSLLPDTRSVAEAREVLRRSLKNAAGN